MFGSCITIRAEQASHTTRRLGLRSNAHTAGEELEAPLRPPILAFIVDGSVGRSAR